MFLFILLFWLAFFNILCYVAIHDESPFRFLQLFPDAHSTPQHNGRTRTSLS